MVHFVKNLMFKHMRIEFSQGTNVQDKNMQFSERYFVALHI